MVCLALKRFTFTCSSVICITSAISLYVFPSKSLSCIQLFCFSGNVSMKVLMRLIRSFCNISSYGLKAESGLSGPTSSSEWFLFSCRLMLSSERFRQIVRLKASMETISFHFSRRFQTLISVSCTMSSASPGLSVMRSASR